MIDLEVDPGATRCGWTEKAPVGHRQPYAADVPATSLGSQDFLDREDANVDRKISGICRGC